MLLGAWLLAAACGAVGDEPRSASVRIGEIDWLVDYEDAVRLARRVDKPLWVHFGEHPG